MQTLERTCKFVLFAHRPNLTRESNNPTSTCLLALEGKTCCDNSKQAPWLVADIDGCQLLKTRLAAQLGTETHTRGPLLFSPHGLSYIQGPDLANDTTLLLRQTPLPVMRGGCVTAPQERKRCLSGPCP